MPAHLIGRPTLRAGAERGVRSTDVARIIQCLSPLGEYNLRLGVLKEVQPDMVATFQEKYALCRPFPSGVRLWMLSVIGTYCERDGNARAYVHAGHPFIVEAAVCLGGPRLKEVRNNDL